MEEFGYWTGFASGFYLGLSISASLTMIALLGIAAIRNPRRNYGLPDRHNIVEFPKADAALPGIG